MPSLAIVLLSRLCRLAITIYLLPLALLLCLASGKKLESCSLLFYSLLNHHVELLCILGLEYGSNLFQASLSIGEPKDLHHFLSRFSLISPAFCGNLEAIERIAMEFVEDCAENGVAYAEARYRYGSIHLVIMQKRGGGSWLFSDHI